MIALKWKQNQIMAEISLSKTAGASLEASNAHMPIPKLFSDEANNNNNYNCRTIVMWIHDMPILKANTWNSFYLIIGSVK